MNIKVVTKILLLYFVCNISSLAQSNQELRYYSYIDSAKSKVDNYPKLANAFLDSIPTPLEKKINGRIAEYYHLKAVVSSHFSEQTEVYYYNLLAFKYAEKENNYDIAGTSSLELFYNLYINDNDSTAFDYLKRAKKFYKLGSNHEGLTEVMQMEAFAEFYKNNYKKSNALILSKLDHYSSIKDDQYYYMYALFMLTSNYVHLEDQVNGRKYLKKFQSLKNNSTIAPLLFKKHEVTLYNCITDMHIKNETLDSILPYLKKVGDLRQFMNNSDIETYYNNCITYYDIIKNEAGKNDYTDSLKIFKQDILKETVDASFNINKTLLENIQSLENGTKKSYFNKTWSIVLVVVLIILMIFVFMRYKNIRNIFNKQKKEYSFLQDNHEKLKVKVTGMEGYISEVKKEVKDISSTSDKDNLQNKIKELNSSIQLNSSTLLSKTENHLELVSKLNVDFFNQLSSKHSNLNSSELIVCYYLFSGFKSKEIGAFLNTSTRAIESKRYRIANKLDVKTQGYNLVDYLKTTFKASKK